MPTEPEEVFQGSGNIFADLELPEPETLLLKARIVGQLYRLFTTRKLTQAKAGELMGITQPEVSRLFKGRFSEYSVERLMGFLTAFDQDVEIIARPHAQAGERGQITFTPITA